VKLLFDENVSPRLVRLLSQDFPGSVHVREAGLRGATDEAIWHYSRANGFALVSKDSDFRDRSILAGSPPKVIWLDVGNAGTAAIARLLRENVDRITEFEKQQESFLILALGLGAI
jgi:predicted nuclease of predicted toxin-antitoxin system